MKEKKRKSCPVYFSILFDLVYFYLGIFCLAPKKCLEYIYMGWIQVAHDITLSNITQFNIFFIECLLDYIFFLCPSWLQNFKMIRDQQLSFIKCLNFKF